MKRNENVHTDDIRKISSKEFAQKNVQLEDKLFSDFLRSDYKAIKEDLPGKTRKQRASYNYIVDIIDTQDVVCMPNQDIKPIVEDKLWKIYEAGYEMALYSIMSRIADYKNDLLEIKNINSRYSDKIVELLFEKDVMNHNELAKELQVTTTNLSNIMKRIRDSKADVLRTERSGKYKIYYLTDNGIRYAKKIVKSKQKKEDQYLKQAWERKVLRNSKNYEDKYDENVFQIVEQRDIEDVQRQLLTDIQQALTIDKQKRSTSLKFNEIINVPAQKIINANGKEMTKNEKQSGTISRRSRRSMEGRTDKKVLC